MTTPLPEPLLTAAEVAPIVRMSVEYVEDQCREGKWPHRKLGSKRRFSAADVDRIIELIAVEPQKQPEPRFAFAPKSRRSA